MASVSDIWDLDNPLTVVDEVSGDEWDFDNPVDIAEPVELFHLDRTPAAPHEYPEGHPYHVPTPSQLPAVAKFGGILGRGAYLGAKSLKENTTQAVADQLDMDVNLMDDLQQVRREASDLDATGLVGTLFGEDIGRGTGDAISSISEFGIATVMAPGPLKAFAPFAVVGVHHANDYHEHVRGGMPESEALAVSGTKFAWEAGLMAASFGIANKLGLDQMEKVFSDRIARGAIASRAKRLFGTSGLEATEETLTEIGHVLVDSYAGLDEGQDPLERIKRAAIGGAIGGGLATGTRAYVEKLINAAPQFRADLQDAYAGTMAAAADQAAGRAAVKGMSRKGFPHPTTKVFREAYQDEMARDPELHEEVRVKLQEAMHRLPARDRKEFHDSMRTYGKYSSDESLLMRAIGNPELALKEYRDARSKAALYNDAFDSRMAGLAKKQRRRRAKGKASTFDVDQTIKDYPELSDGLTEEAARDRMRYLLENPGSLERFRKKPWDYIEQPKKQSQKPEAQEAQEVQKTEELQQEFSGIPVSPRIDLKNLMFKFGLGKKSAAKELARYFTRTGLAPAEIFELWQQRGAKISVATRTAHHLLEDLNTALFDEYKRKQLLDPVVIHKLDAALKGQMTDLSVEITSKMKLLRDHLDYLSKEIIGPGLANEKLQVTIEGNKGFYVHRTYRKHREKNYKDRALADEELMDASRDWFRQRNAEIKEPLTDQQIEGAIHYILDKDSVEAKRLPASYVGDKGFLDILMQRKDIPDAIRKLMGEYHDPWVNYTTSVSKMASLVAHREFLVEVKDLGLKAGLFVTEPTATHDRELEAIANPLMESLYTVTDQDGNKHKLYAQPEVVEGIADLFKIDAIGGVLRYFARASAFVKWGATVGNPPTYLRNFLGNISSALSNGDMIYDLTSGQFMANWRRVTTDRDYQLKMIRLRIMSQEVHTGEMRRNMELAAEAELHPDIVTASRGKVVAKKILWTIPSGWYNHLDLAWKVNAFEHKKIEYAKAYPQATEAEIEEMAARNVIRRYPSYSEVSRGVRQLSAQPWFAPFITFHTEVLRTTKNSLMDIKEGLASSNPQIRKMAGGQAAGLALSMVASYGAARLLRMMVGASDEEDRDIRWFQPPWTRNSLFLWVKPLQDGRATVFDLSWMDPRAVFIKPIVAALQSPGDFNQKFVEALGEAVSPLGEDLLMGRLLSVYYNQRDNGGVIYTPGADPDYQARQIYYYLNVLAPGVFGKLSRIQKGWREEVSRGGTPYNFIMELIGTMGIRPTPVDVAQSYSFRAGDYGQLMKDAQNSVSGVFGGKGTVKESWMIKTYRTMDRARRKHFSRLAEMTDAAIRSGGGQQEIVRSLRAAVGSNEWTERVLARKYEPYWPSESALQKILSRPDGARRIEILRGEYERARAEIAEAEMVQGTAQAENL